MDYLFRMNYLCYLIVTDPILFYVGEFWSSRDTLWKRLFRAHLNDYTGQEDNVRVEALGVV